MSSEMLIAVAQLTAVLVGGVAIFLTLRGVRDQLWVMTFTEYTRRYGEIVKDLPAEARRPGGNFDPQRLTQDERDTLLNTVRAYINLCSEEYWLQRRKRIDKETWAVWKLGIRETMGLPWLKSTWGTMKSEYSYFREFRDFMDECLRETESDAALA